MKSLYDASAVKEIKDRINKITEKNTRQWGAMGVAQMLAHCTGGLEMALGERVIPRILVGRIMGPFLKAGYYNDKPYPKNLKTASPLKIISQRKFKIEQKQLLETIDRFYQGGPDSCTKHPHPFFGKLTPSQWAKGMYKHLDHHLKQFSA